MNIKSKFEFLSRAVNYWKIYGTREFITLTYLYMRGRVHSQEIRLDAHYSLLSDTRVNSKSTQAPQLFASAFIAIIGDLSLPQCKKYRVLQKVDVLRSLGVQSDYSSWTDISRSMELLQIATAVIFYRVTSNDNFDALVKECDRLGVLKIYDIDDPVFSASIYSSNQNIDYLVPAEKENLINGCIHFLNALKLCDVLVGSTPKICSLLEKEGGKPAYIWRNLVDTEIQQYANEFIPNNSLKSDYSVVIGYASGSRAHEADFRTISKVLCKILAEKDNIELRILGHLELPEELKRFKKKIRQSGFVGYRQYMSELSRLDINLVPLVIDEFNECKSVIRFTEASLFQIPTVASAVGDFKNVVMNGANGFLAESEEDWINHVEKLIESPSLRKEVGANAKHFVSNNFVFDDGDTMHCLDNELLEIIVNGK